MASNLKISFYVNEIFMKLKLSLITSSENIIAKDQPAHQCSFNSTICCLVPRQHNHSRFYIQNIKTVAILFSCTFWFLSNLFKNAAFFFLIQLISFSVLHEIMNTYILPVHHCHRAQLRIPSPCQCVPDQGLSVQTSHRHWCPGVQYCIPARQH